MNRYQRELKTHFSLNNDSTRRLRHFIIIINKDIFSFTNPNLIGIQSEFFLIILTKLN